MILCFSGTGNSLYAARLISAAAGDEVVSLNALLRGGGPARFSSERPYVVVSPTHGWRLPAAVEALLRGVLAHDPNPNCRQHEEGHSCCHGEGGGCCHE